VLCAVVGRFELLASRPFASSSNFDVASAHSVSLVGCRSCRMGVAFLRRRAYRESVLVERVLVRFSKLRRLESYLRLRVAKSGRESTKRVWHVKLVI